MGLLFFGRRRKCRQERYRNEKGQKRQNGVDDHHALGAEKDVVGRPDDKKIGGSLIAYGWLKGHLDIKHSGLVDFIVGDGRCFGADLSVGIFVIKRQETAVKEFFADGGPVHNLVFGVLNRSDNRNGEKEEKDEDGKNEDGLFQGVHDFKILFMKEEKIFFIFLFLVLIGIEFKFVELAGTTRLDDGV